MIKSILATTLFLANSTFVHAKAPKLEAHAFYQKAPACQKAESHHEFVLCLNRYAEELLKDKNSQGVMNPLRDQLLSDLETAQIKLSEAQTTLEIFKINIDHLNKSCFDFSDLDEDEKQEVSEKIASQMREAALFLKSFHLLTLGAKRGLFQIDQIQICSEEGLGRNMKYEGGILKLGLDDDFESQSFESIKDDWNERKHLQVQSTFIDLQKWMDQRLSRVIGFALSSSQVRREIEQDKIWQFINPIGHIRAEARKSIRYITSRGVQLLRQRIQDFKSNLKMSPDMTPDKVQELVANQQKSILLQKLKSDLVLKNIVPASLLEKVQKLDAKKTDQLYSRWLEKSEDVHLAETVISSSQEIVYNQNVDVKVTRTGESWIKVTNWHVILASMNLNSGASVTPEVEGLIKDEVKHSPSIKIEHVDHSNATIHVDTFDYITATFSATSNKAIDISKKILPTAALHEALNELGYLQDEVVLTQP